MPANNPEDKCCLRVDYVTVFQNVGGGEVVGASAGCNLCFAAVSFTMETVI